jgi:hypothetical protein
MRQRLIVLVIAAAGCPSFKPQNGKLKCSADSARRCPDGYNCIVGSCWIDGQSPDLAPPLDLAPIPDLTPPPADLVVIPDLAPRVNGVACSSATDCISGFCVDGVCCKSDCSHDACRACNLTSSLGTCAFIPVGGVPAAGHVACGPDAKSTCNRDGTCDGAGACHLWATGTVCGTGSCNSGTNMVTSAPTCDGKGACKSGATITCAPYVCKDTVSCWPSCTTVAQCASPNSCTANSCGLKVNGSICGGDGECSSQFCTDGHCCNMRCSGQCQACDLGGSNNGMCLTVTSGQPHGSRPMCNGTNVSNNVCAGQCDGTYVGKCDYAGSSTTCLSPSCADSTDEQPAETCDGNGTCTPQAVVSCGLLVCRGTACLKSCTNAFNDCSGGNNDYCCSTTDCQLGQCYPRIPRNSSCTHSYECATSCCCNAGSGVQCVSAGFCTCITP